MMRTIERPGALVSYELSGSGPPIVLGHSLLCDGRMWDGVSERLARRYTVINVDARGHRHSTAPGPFVLETLADDWRAIMDHEGIQRAVLCGLSMGGMTAMRLALRAPGRVAGLALLDTSSDPEPKLKRLKYNVMNAVLRRFGHLRAFESQIKPLMFGERMIAERPEVVDEVVERIRGQDPAQLYWAVRAVSRRESITEHLPYIDCPTLVIVGDQDNATPPFRSETIRDGIPAASLARLEAVGHLCTVEAPERVLDELEPFLEKISW